VSEGLRRSFQYSRRLGSRGIGIHSLRNTLINDTTTNGATMHKVQEFAGCADIWAIEVYFGRREEDAEVAAHTDPAGRFQGPVKP